jgi:hypothetical protein
MSATTVELSEASRELLRELAEKTGLTAAQVLDRALAIYRRQVFFDKLNTGYAGLRADPEQWAEHEAERAQLDAANLDGLDRNEVWSDDGSAAHG